METNRKDQQLNNYIEDALSAKEYSQEQLEESVWKRVSERTKSKFNLLAILNTALLYKISAIMLIVISFGFLLSNNSREILENDFVLKEDAALSATSETEDAEIELSENLLAFDDHAQQQEKENDTSTPTVLNNECDQLLIEIDETIDSLNPEVDFSDFEL